MVKQFGDRADLVSQLPKIELTEPVTRYFDLVQQAVGLNRQLAIQWAELFTSFSGSVREQAEKVGGIVTDQVDSVADLAVAPARKAEELAGEQAALAEEAAKEEEREIKRAERAAAKQAREPYEGLTKAELSDQLAEGGPPKTGNVDELIERLVSADSEQPTAVPECNDAGVGSPSPPHRRRCRRSTLMLQTVCARPATRQLRRH